jgi:hypothetical protein
MIIIGEGLDNIAVLVNEVTVFRILKPGHENKNITSEINFLKLTKGRLTVGIPHITYEAIDRLLYGYKLLPGSTIVKNTLTKESRADEYIDKWVITACELEAIGESAKLPIDQFSDNDYRLKKSNEVLKLDILDTSVRNLLKKSCNRYLEKWKKRKKVLVHGDLGMGSWLYDNESDHYSVIDWSDVCFAPQEFQMYRLVADLPEHAAYIISKYEKKTDNTIDHNLLFDCGLISIASRIAECIEREPALVESKIQELRAWSQLSV